MAGKSLGTLTIDLIAKVGGFVSGMDKAERASDKWRRGVEKNVKSAGVLVAGIAGVAAATASAIAAAGISLLKNTSQQITETDRWAKSLNLSTQSLLEWQYAAKQAGLSGDKIADIFKDLNDKIGDAVLNKSGAAAQALDTIGLSAKKLQALSPDRQLLAISDAMKGMNTAQKTNIYESLGNDLSRLIPLLDNGAEGFSKFQKQARDLGVAPHQEDIDKLVRINDIFQEIESSWEGFRTKIAVGLADIDLSSLVNSVHSIQKTFTDPAVLQGIANIVTGFTNMVDLLGQAAKLANDMAYGWGKTASTRSDSSFNDLLAKRKELNESLQYSETFLGKIDVAAGVVRSSSQIRSEIAKNEALIKNFSSKNILSPGPATLSVKNPYALDKGEHNQKVKVDHAALSLDNSFKAVERSYLRQISLIDTTGKKTSVITEQQKLAFDLSSGKLAGLNALQQKRLQSLAAEVDRLNSVKKANQDNAKVAAYVATLQESNANNKQGLDADFIGAGMGDKTRDRLRELASIRQNFTNQQFELNKQYSEDGNKEVYDKESAALKEALNRRLEYQKKYYNQLDSLQGDWVTGFKDGLQNSIDTSNNLYQKLGDFAQSTYSSMSDALADFVVTGKASFRDFTKSILSDLAKIALQKSLAGIAGSLFSAGTSATGAVQPISGGSTLSGGLGALGIPADFSLYDSGGFTGRGGKYDPAGIVHKGEFVFTKEATSRIGLNTLYSMMKGYSDGGYVGGSVAQTPSAASHLSNNSGFSMGDINVTIDNSGRASAASDIEGQSIAKQIQQAVVNTINDQASRQGTPLWRVIKGR